MRRDEAVQVDQSCKSYLQKNKLRSVFADLVREVVLKRPDDPISHLINYLDKGPRRLIVCVQGYDNQERKRLAKIITNKLNFKLIQVSDIFNDSDYHLQNDQKINQKVLTVLKSSEAVYKGILLSGYPNNIQQLDFIQKSGFLPSRYFLLPFDQVKLKQSLKKTNTQQEAKSILKRNQMQKKQLLEGLCEMLDFLPINVEEAAEKLALTLNVKVNKKILPYDSPRIIIVHPPYICPPTIKKLIQNYYLHHISVQKCLEKLSKKQNLKDYVEKYIRKSGSLSKQIELALIQTECKSAAAKNKGYLLSGWPNSKKHLTFLKEKFLSPHLIFVFDLDAQSCEQKFSKIQKGDPLIFSVSQKPSVQEYHKQLQNYNKVVEHLKENYKIQILPWGENEKQVLKTFESLIENPKIYS